MKCPHCGFDLTPPSEFREQLAKLADGTRKTKEIAEIVGRPLSVVISTLSNMKKQGINVVCKPFIDNKERDAQIVSDRLEGMTYKKLGIKYGLSLERARAIFILSQRRAPKPPPRL